MAKNEYFCLKQNDFHKNVLRTWRDLQMDKDFCDVVLACDNKQIEAHKAIVSSSSPVLRNILNQNSNKKPLIYLRGINYEDLQNVINFIYQGEVNIATDDLSSFLEVAKDLQIQGLAEDNGINSNTTKKLRQDDHVGNIALNIKSEIDDDNENMTSVHEQHIYEPTECDDFTSTEFVITEDSSNEIAKQETFENNKFNTITVSTRKMIPCPKCDKQFTHRGTLNRHIRSIHDGITYPCDQCDHKATTKGSLKQHIISQHEGAFYQCAHCEYKASTTSRLSIHIKSIHEGVRYPCSLCNYQATEKGHLKNHINAIHKGIRYKCDYCEYQASQQRKLRVHMEKFHLNDPLNYLQ